MAFLRFSRDKRGYEHFYLVEATTNRRGKTRARVLYWFRTPPGIKVGREPFDADVRQALEAQNPDVAFDWRKIVETPIPSAEVERWRERRRLEKAEKAARRARAADQSVDDEVEEPTEMTAEQEEQIAEAEELALDAAEQQEDALPPVLDTAIAAPVEQQRRRRRRRRRGPRSPQGSPGSDGSGSQGSQGSGGEA